jgi:hypothetical protein
MFILSLHIVCGYGVHVVVAVAVASVTVVAVAVLPLLWLSHHLSLIMVIRVVAALLCYGCLIT